MEIPSQREEELARAGWSRRFVIGPTRIKEVSELYEQLGMAVHLEPIPAESLAGDCAGCALATTFFRMVYTRPASPTGG